MEEPSLVKALIGFGVFILWMLLQFWLAKRGPLGKGIQKYFDSDSGHKKH